MHGIELSVILHIVLFWVVCVRFRPSKITLFVYFFYSLNDFIHSFIHSVISFHSGAGTGHWCTFLAFQLLTDYCLFTLVYLELCDWSTALKQHGVAVEEWRDNWPQNCEQATSIRDVKRRWQSCRDRHPTSLHHSENEKGETRCVALLFLEVAIARHL